MIIKQRSTFVDPFLLKVVCPNLDSRPLRWLLNRLGMWNQEARWENESNRHHFSEIASPITLPRVLSPVAVRKLDGSRGTTRRRR